MHGRRAFAATAAAGLLVSLFAPWYRETVVAPGLTGLRTLTLTRSGWQAFSATELLILVVGVLTLLITIGVRSDVPGAARPIGCEWRAWSSLCLAQSRSWSCWQG